MWKHCSWDISTFHCQVLNVFAWFTILQHKVEYYGGIKIPGFHVNTSWCPTMIVSLVYPDYRISSLSPGVDQSEDSMRSRDQISANQRPVWGSGWPVRAAIMSLWWWILVSFKPGRPKNQFPLCPQSLCQQNQKNTICDSYDVIQTLKLPWETIWCQQSTEYRASCPSVSWARE